MVGVQAILGADEQVRVVSWTRGVFAVGERSDSLPPQVTLAVYSVPGAQKPHDACLTIRCEPSLAKFMDAAGAVETVQTFRYVGSDGDPRRMLLCGSCGHTLVTDMGDLMRGVPSTCRACHADRHRGVCPLFHAYGVCADCRTENKPC